MAKSVINVLINADSKGFSRGIDKMVSEFSRLETKGQKFSYAMEKAFIPAAAALAGITAAVAPAITKASDLNENLSKTSVVFGDAADAVVEFSESASKTLGQSQTQALEAAGNFGIFGKSAGLAGDDLSKFSTDFITLASDMASFNNTEPQEAVEAIGAALRGESEPIRKYGVLLNDATLKAEAMELGIYDGVGALDAQQKILAAQSAIYKQTGDAQGDFARTSDGLANMQRTLTAQFDDFQATLGQALLPIVEAILPVLIGLTDWAADNTGVVLGLVAAFAAIAGAVVAVNVAMKLYATYQALATAATWLWNAALSANPIGLIIIAIAALIAIFVVLQKKFDIIGLAIDGLRLAFELAWDGIKWVINKIIDGINSIIGLLNKIPGVDIPEIGHLGDEAEEAAEKVKKSKEEFTIFAEQAEEMREPLGRFESSVSNITEELDIFENEVEGIREPLGRFETSMSKAKDEGDKLETTLGRVDEAFDPLNEGIETATTRLDKFFESLDQQQASDEFVEDLEEIATKLASVTEGSDAWQEAQIEAYEALRTFRDAREDLPDAFFEVIKLEIDTGDLDRAIELINSVVDLGGYSIPVDFATNFSGYGVPDFKMPSTFDFVPLATGGIVTQPTIGLVGEAGAEAIIPLDRMGSMGSGTTNITVNMPVGSNGDDVVRALNSYSKRHGGLTVPTLSGVRGR